MYILNMVIILIVMYSNVVTAIDKIPTYLLRFNTPDLHAFIVLRGLLCGVSKPSGEDENVKKLTRLVRLFSLRH